VSKVLGVLAGPQGKVEARSEENTQRPSLVSTPHLARIMAAVHPSRLHLVPQKANSSGRNDDRSRRRSRSRSPRRDRDQARRASPEYRDYRRPSPPPEQPRDSTRNAPPRNYYENRGNKGSDYLERYAACSYLYVDEYSSILVAVSNAKL
jgi:hypothetical protein